MHRSTFHHGACTQGCQAPIGQADDWYCAMDAKIAELTRTLRTRPGTPAHLIEEVERALGVRFPKDYADFLATSDGAEGFIGEQDNAYLSLWPVERLAEMNAAYKTNEYSPGLLLFGSDGGGEGYAFDLRSSEPSVVQMPFDSIDPRDARACGRTFTEFLELLSKW